MTDETRDPEIECVRANWDAPPPSAGFHEQMMTAYDRQFSGAPLWRRWFAIRVPLPVVVAAVVGAFVLAFFTAPYFGASITQKSTHLGLAGYRYRPVHQPSFVVISQGEHP